MSDLQVNYRDKDIYFIFISLEGSQVCVGFEHFNFFACVALSLEACV